MPDAKAQKIAYTYDTYKRMTMTQRYPSPGTTEDTCQRATYYYDGGLPSGVSWTSQYSSGRLSAMQWGQTGCATPYQFTELYTYTPAGLVTTKQLNVASSTQSFSLQTSQTYDNMGRVQTVTYPDAAGNDPLTPGGPITPTTLTTLYDGSGRPIQLTDYTGSTPYTWVNNVQYGPSSELKQISYNCPYFPDGYTAANFVNETRTYNSRVQLTNISGSIAMTYTYSATQNNGQIMQQTDGSSGEQVTYAYDALNRLIAATASGSWGLSFSYDGFGNRTASTPTQGSAPSSSLSFDGSNHVIGFSYDANGNMLTAPSVSGMSYDVENRLVTAGGDSYAYSPNGKRIWKMKPSGTQEFYFYSISGQKLGTYNASGSTATALDANVYFGSRMIVSRGNVVGLDRVGSVRTAVNVGASRFFPYGEEETTTPVQDRDKFATYYRDGTTGLDYAQNRYYASTLGRFITPDPFKAASAGPSDPQSWNKYEYTRGDPVNRIDPTGLDDCPTQYLACATGIAPQEPPPEQPQTQQPPPDNPLPQGPAQQPSPATAWINVLVKGLQNVVNIAKRALSNPQCAALFGWQPNGDPGMDPDYPYPGSDPGEVLQSLVDAGSVTFTNLALVPGGSLDGVTARAITTVGSPVLINGSWEWTSAQIQINSAQQAGYWGYTTPTTNAATLLHELGHVYDMVAGYGGSAIKNDAGNGQLSGANTDLINKTCFP